MIAWDRDMVAAIGDYQLRIWPNVSDEWTWYVYLAAPEALHTVAGGTAPDEVAARAAAEKALIRRLASYQGLAIAAELTRLRRIETAACGWRAARDAARSGGNWRPGEPARRFEDACDVLAAVLMATADGSSGHGSGDALPPFDAGIERTAPAAPPSRFRVGLAEHPKDDDPWIEGDIDVAIAHADGLSRVRGHGVWAVWDRRCEVAAIVFEGAVFTP